MTCCTFVVSNKFDLNQTIRVYHKDSGPIETCGLYYKNIGNVNTPLESS